MTRREPTARQMQVHEAVVRHRGNYEQAGRELGITGQAVGFSERRYLEATGEERLIARRAPHRPSRIEILGALPDRMTALEARLADQLLAGEAMRLQIAELTTAIEGFMARQPLILEVRPRHERQADGGRGGREELRATGRALRKVVGG